MSDADDVEVVASGFALHQVSQWLGVSAEDVLNETDATTDALFEKPRPSLLGLGAKYVSHKSMEQSGLEHKLKQRLKRSADGSNAAAGYQPAQLNRHMQQRGKRKHGDDGQGQQRAVQQHDSSDDEDGGKLSALQQNKKQHHHQQQQRTAGGNKGQQQQQPQPGRKVFDRAQLLAVPVENLSKWQRKRMRQKEKAAAAAQQQ